MKSLTSKMSVSTAVMAMTTGIVVTSLLFVGFIAYFVLSDKVQEDAARSQDLSLRTAASIFSDHLTGSDVSWASNGDVSGIRIAQIPEFPDHSMIDEIGRITGETATVFVWDDASRDFWRRTTNIVKPDGTRAVGTPLGQNGKVYPVVTKGETYRGEATILGKDYFTVYQPILNDSGNIIGILYVGVEKSKISSVVGHMMWTFGLAFIPVIGAGILVSIFLTRRLLRPVSELGQITERIAHDDLSVHIPHTDREDEIGVLAKSVARLKERSAERIALEARQDEADQKVLERQKKIEALIAGFRGRIGDLITSVNQTLGGLDNTASVLTSIAQDSAGRASETLHASDEAASSVSLVAAAADEMNSSISEIDRQVKMTAEIVHKANEASTRTNEQVENLVQSASRISEVVNLIRNIAEQTNLLALNATIEAARAGEAGKGFAVVAAEVKELSTQTSRATEEITDQIAAIQSAMSSSVEAITEITSTIGEVNSFTASIATSVQEQGSATAEIAGSVQNASRGTAAVSENINQLSGAVSQTNDSANSVMQAARGLAEQTDGLSKEVERFLAEVSAA